MKSNIKTHLPLYTLLVLSIAWYLWAIVQWGQCPVIDCSENFIDFWLSTSKTGSQLLILCLIPFLFLSKEYFTKWLKYIFSWGFPLALYMTYITTGSHSIPAYGKDDIARFWGIFFVVVTALFIAGHLLYNWKKKRKN